MEESHLLKAAFLALGHRTREEGFQPPATPEEIQKTVGETFDKSKDIENGDILRKEDDSAAAFYVDTPASESTFAIIS